MGKEREMTRTSWRLPMNRVERQAQRGAGSEPSSGLLQGWMGVGAFGDPHRVVSENGVVLVSVRNNTYDTTLLCTGLAGVRNTFPDLVGLLRAEQYIGRKERILSCARYEGNLLLPADYGNDTFDSGTRVLIEVAPIPRRQSRPRTNTLPRKRAIKKIA